jgi:alkaline phosphatase
MKYRISSWIWIVLLLVFVSCGSSVDKKSDDQNKPKYIFYFIGDGMGMQHVRLTEAFLQAGKTDQPGFQQLAFDTLPYFGMADTYAKNRLITGSAAAGTALATGHKTNIDAIGVSPGAKTDYLSIAWRFKNEGKKVGIISSVSIDHATPAAFYAHQTNRSNYFEIGKQLASSDYDFFGGGGFRYPEKDSVNLYDLAEKSGYRVFRNENGLEKIPKDTNVLLVNPVLGPEGEMPYAIDRKFDGGYSLAQITRAAIDNLFGEQGFFIMVEGGKIDWASHSNDAASLVREVMDFDFAVREALKFYSQHPDETLIVVTSDHETGGIALGNTAMRYQSDFDLLTKQRMSVERVSRLLYDEKIRPEELKKVFGLDSLSKSEINRIEQAAKINGWSDDIKYGGYMPLPITYNIITNERAGVGFTTWSHTAAPVPVYAIGPGAEQFSGQMDNTDIPRRILRAAGLNF